MRRLVLLLFVVATLAAASGCSICASPDDEAYPAYGGIVQRQDPYHGRVGSAFGSGVAAVSHEGEFSEEIGDDFVKEWPSDELGSAVDEAPAEVIPAPETQPESGDPQEESEEAPAEPEVFYE